MNGKPFAARPLSATLRVRPLGGREKPLRATRKRLLRRLHEKGRLTLVEELRVEELRVGGFSGGAGETPRHSLRSAWSRVLLRPLRGSAFGLGQPDDFVAGASPYGSRPPSRGSPREGVGECGSGLQHFGDKARFCSLGGDFAETTTIGVAVICHFPSLSVTHHLSTVAP